MRGCWTRLWWQRPEQPGERRSLMIRFQRRMILGLILATFLVTAPAVSAAPLSAVEPRTVLAQLWSFLTGGAWVPVSPDIGCSYDPDGMHCPGESAAPAGDIGCS